MTELITILSDLVQSEHAQWMRYTYLSALGWGLHTDSLHEHFADHGGDELGHAQELTRWIVDLGGLPPTCVPPIEQFQGSAQEAIAWLLQAEIEGLNKYHMLRAAAEGIPGLQAEIDNILIAEHDHISDLMRLCEVPEEDDTTIIVIAAHSPHQAMKCVADRRCAISGRESLDWIGQVMAPMSLLTPEEKLEHVKKAIENEITKLWPRRESPEAQDQLEDWKDMYQMVSDPASWRAIYNYVFPPKQTAQEMMQQIPARPDGEYVIDDGETTSQPAPQVPAPKPAPQAPVAQPAPQGPRRPSETVLAAHMATHPENRRKYPVEVGDRVRNMDTRMLGTVHKLLPNALWVVTDRDGPKQWSMQDNIQFDAKDRTTLDKALSRVQR